MFTAGMIAAVLMAVSEPTAAESVQCALSAEVPADRGRLTIHVIDANSGVRLPASKLFVSGDAGGREFEADQHGSRQIDGVPPGDYLVLADHEVGSDQLMISVAPGHECEIIFRLGDVVLIEQEEVVSAEALAERRLQRERGATLRGSGIGVLALGGALAVGAVLAAMVNSCSTSGEATGVCSNDTQRSLALGFGVSGGLAIAGGITMVAVGSRRSRVEAAVFPTRGGAAFSVHARF